ncbi:MAG: ABC transporter permease subunit, partial [Clostridia bacterium]|nr:ABC transporter permease subunit [Deltaproteobacteria bacterium]
MIWVIALKELRGLLRDTRVRLATCALLSLTVVTAIAGSQRHHRFEAEQEEHEKRSRAAWNSQGPRHPHTAAHFGLYLYEPHGNLATIDPGLTPYLGRAVWLEAHNQNTMKYRPVEDAPAIAAYAGSAIATILQCIVPLFIIVLGFGAFAGERDSGTLRQLLVAGASPRALLLGKTLGIAFVLAVVNAPILILAVGSVLTQSSSTDAFGRACMMAAAYALYFYTVLMLTIAVSARSMHGRGALVSLLAGWLVVTVLVPRVAADVADYRAPIPSAAAFWTAIDADLQRDGGLEARVKNLEARTLTAYGVDRREDLPIEFEGLALDEDEKHHNEVFDVRYRDLFDKYRQQERTYESFGLAAPFFERSPFVHDAGGVGARIAPRL